MDPIHRLELDRLVKHQAYWDPKHPEHDLVKHKVSEMHKIEHEAENGGVELHGRRVNPMVFDTTPATPAPPGSDTALAAGR